MAFRGAAGLPVLHPVAAKSLRLVDPANSDWEIVLNNDGDDASIFVRYAPGGDEVNIVNITGDGFLQLATNAVPGGPPTGSTTIRSTSHAGAVVARAVGGAASERTGEAALTASVPTVADAEFSLDLPRSGTNVPAATSDGAKLFARVNGGGKVELCAIFPTGAEQIIATQP